VLVAVASTDMPLAISLERGGCPLLYQIILDASSARSSPGSPPAGTLRESKPDVHFSTAQKRKIRITNHVLEIERCPS